MLRDVVQTRDLEEVKKIASRAATTIEFNSHPQHPDTEQDSRAKQYQESTLRALRVLAEGTSKPDILRRELAPGILLTSFYSENRLMRLQIRELKKEGTVEIHLLKVNHNTEEDARSKTALFSDIPCTSYVLSGNGIQLKRAEIDTMVRFPEAGGAGDDHFVSTNTAPVEDVPPQPSSRLRVITDKLTDPSLKRNKQVETHLAALETAKSVLLKGNFELTDSSGTGLAQRVIDDIRTDLEIFLKHGLIDESFAKLVDRKNEEVLETRIADQKNGYRLIISHLVGAMHLQIAVFKDAQDQNDIPSAAIDIDLQRQLARVSQANVTLGRLKERGMTGALSESLPEFQFNTEPMGRRFASAAIQVEAQGGPNREYVVKAIAAIMGSEFVAGYALINKPRKVVRMNESGNYVLETRISAPNDMTVVIEETLLSTTDLAVADKFKIALKKNQGDQLVREWEIEASLHDDAIPVAMKNLKTTGMLTPVE